MISEVETGLTYFNIQIHHGQRVQQLLSPVSSATSIAGIQWHLSELKVGEN